jgi:asparagine synthetase B (glutamine-hydrolysing)
MMVSLESRAVFLGNDLVEFCRRLPGRFKLHNGRRKWLLRKALEPWLPAQTLERRKKGFGIPLAKWLRHWPVPVNGSLDGAKVNQRLLDRGALEAACSRQVR